MQTWKKSIAVVTVTATVISGFSSSLALAQQARVTRASDALPVPVDRAVPADQTALILSTVQPYPNGGEPLKLAISDLIVKHPKLAPSVAMFLRNSPSLTRAQKQAIFAGLADAFNRMGIVAADMPVKALPAEAPEPGISPWLIALLLAGAGAGIGCAIACNQGGGPVASPN